MARHSNIKLNQAKVVKLPEEKRKKTEAHVTDPGLLNRTAWTNATVALDHIKKVRYFLVFCQIFSCVSDGPVRGATD